MPDRIEFDLTADQGRCSGPATATRAHVDGRFLYGAPAAGLRLEGEVRVVHDARAWESFTGYFFGLADGGRGVERARRWPTCRLTDDDGKATFAVPLDELPSTTRLLAADVVLRMREAGGRAVERSLNLAGPLARDLIGIKPEFAGDDGADKDGTPASASSPSIRRRHAGRWPALHWSLVKLERNYQWYRSRQTAGTTSRSPSTRRSADGTIDISADRRPARIAVPVDWGRYRLEVETPDADGASHQLRVRRRLVCRGQASTETPDGLEVALDKANYAAGETAKLKVSPRFAGEAAGRRSAPTRLLTTVDGDRAGRRRDRRHPGHRRLGRRRLCHGDPVPARRRPGNAHAACAPSA